MKDNSRSARSRASMLKLWADPTYRAHMTKVRKQQVTPEEKERLRNLVVGNWSNPKIRKHLTKHLREISQSKEGRKSNSKRTEKLWTDPEYRANQIKAIHNKKWKKAVSEANTLFKTGKPAWNAGYTKYTHPSLMKLSCTNMGRIPDYNLFKCYYPNKEHPRLEMRSSWEVAFALWLDAGGIKWEYQVEYFHVGRGIWKGETYTPDFYLPDTRVYVELKGYLSKENAAKMKRFHKLYPEVQLWEFYHKHLSQVLEFKPRKAA